MNGKRSVVMFLAIVATVIGVSFLAASLPEKTVNSEPYPPAPEIIWTDFYLSSVRGQWVAEWFYRNSAHTEGTFFMTVQSGERICENVLENTNCDCLVHTEGETGAIQCFFDSAISLTYPHFPHACMWVVWWEYTDGFTDPVGTWAGTCGFAFLPIGLKKTVP